MLDQELDNLWAREMLKPRGDHCKWRRRGDGVHGSSFDSSSFVRPRGRKDGYKSTEEVHHGSGVKDSKQFVGVTGGSSTRVLEDALLLLGGLERTFVDRVGFAERGRPRAGT
jgi:hypothetical protein